MSLFSASAQAATLPADANTTCPIMLGEESDPDIFVEHEGEKIYFCCAKCKREFKRDPAKYAAMVKEAKREEKKTKTNTGAKDSKTSSSR